MPFANANKLSTRLPGYLSSSTLRRHVRHGLLGPVQFVIKPNVSFPTNTRTLFTVIHQGFEGWRLSFGRDPVKLAPGLHLNIPIYHNTRVIDMRETSINIQDLTAFTSDNVPVLLSGSLFFIVRNSYDACFSISEYKRNIENIGTSALRSVVGHFSYDDVIADRNKINTKLHEVIGSTTEKWGVDCARFEIQTFKPHNREVEKQLELQMQAERERRKQLLDTQALVNVAEGQKQRTILQSEGELRRRLNQAEGDKQGRILASEGFYQASVNEGRALAQQIQLVAEAISIDSKEEPTTEMKLRSLDALIKLKRIEQLKAIATGNSNSTYFFGDDMPVSADNGAYAVDNMEKWKRSLPMKAN